MKLTSVELHPAGSSAVGVLSFRDPGRANPYTVKSIVGLDADEIVPRFYGGSGNAIKFYNLALEKRNIVLQIALNPRYALGESFSGLRDGLYKMIASSRTGVVELQFKNADTVVASISGFVTKVEAPQFEKTQEIQITVRCDDPLLRGPDPIVTTSPTFLNDASYNRFTANQASGELSFGTVWTGAVNGVNNPTDGVRAFRMTRGTSGTGYAQPVSVIPIVGGHDYTFSLDAISSVAGRSFSLAIQYLNGAGAILAETNTPHVTSVTSERLSHTASAPVGSVNALPYLIYPGGVAGETVDFDSMALRQGSSAEYSEPGTNGDYLNIPDNASTAPHGFKAEIGFTGAMASLTIVDPEDPTWSFQVTPSLYGGFLTGDLLRFSSEYNDKYLNVVRGGVSYPLADAIVPGSVWPVLFPGDNLFKLSNSASLHWNSISYFPTYWGV